MKTAAVSKLKASLSEYLSKVKAGEDVIITDRGKPVAKIISLRREGMKISPHLLALERSGLARIGKGLLPEDFWNMPRPGDKKGRAIEYLLEEREKGR